MKKDTEHIVQLMMKGIKSFEYLGDDPGLPICGAIREWEEEGVLVQEWIQEPGSLPVITPVKGAVAFTAGTPEVVSIPDGILDPAGGIVAKRVPDTHDALVPPVLYPEEEEKYIEPVVRRLVQASKGATRLIVVRSPGYTGVGFYVERMKKEEDSD